MGACIGPQKLFVFVCVEDVFASREEPHSSFSLIAGVTFLRTGAFVGVLCDAATSIRASKQVDGNLNCLDHA